MDPLISGLLNFGSMGALAAVLLYLHTTSLKRFSDELAIAREQCSKDHEKIMLGIHSLHNQLLLFRREDGK